jgi:hypothetical protein
MAGKWQKARILAGAMLSIQLIEVIRADARQRKVRLYFWIGGVRLLFCTSSIVHRARLDVSTHPDKIVALKLGSIAVVVILSFIIATMETDIRE